MPPKPSAKGAKKAAKSQKVSRTGEKKKKKSRKESYSVYVYRVLKQVHPDTGISSKAMSIMNSFVNDVFERIAGEASKLAHYNKRSTIASREIQTAVRLILPGELAKHAVSEGTKAVTKYTSTKSVCGDEDGNLHITIRPEKITGKWQYSMSRYGSFESDMFEYVGDISKTKSFERIARVVIDEKDKKYAFRGNREVKWETISISEAKSKLVPFLVERHTTWAELFVAGTPTKDYKEFVNTFCESFGVQKTLKDITMGYYGKPSEHFIVRQAKSGRLALLTLTGEWPDQGLYILKTCMPLLTSVPLHKPQIRQGVVRFCREHGTVAVDKLYAQSVHKEKSHGANDESAHWAVGGSSDLGFADKVHITIRPEKGSGKWQYSLSRFVFENGKFFEYIGDISKAKSSEFVERVVIGETDKKYGENGNREVKWETISVADAKSKLIPFIVERHADWTELFVSGKPTKDMEELIKIFTEGVGAKKVYKEITMGYYGKPSEEFIIKQVKTDRVTDVTLTGDWPDHGLAILKAYLPVLDFGRLTLPEKTSLKFDKDLIDVVVNSYIKGKMNGISNVKGTLAADKLYAQSLHKDKQGTLSPELVKKGYAYWSTEGNSDLTFVLEGKNASFESHQRIN
ncbi:hypothetical protein QR680_000223 [Steinernema hermaphroditum]|uniref:Histone H2B n=1 Tax=Steinernema hermaphroditum TaxID=289476 RepID=A0AA39GTV6_9BILA|nr:hypothetical protein QR680_000223 [Steinernema hermaphroditum]